MSAVDASLGYFQFAPSDTATDLNFHKMVTYKSWDSCAAHLMTKVLTKLPVLTKLMLMW